MRQSLASFASLATFDRMETLLNILDGACSFAVETGQVLETRAGVSGELGVEFAAVETADILGQVLLVQIGDVLVLVLAYEDQIALSTEIAFDVQFSLEKVQNVLCFSLDSRANRHEVDPGGLRGGEHACAWVLALLVLLLLVVVLVVHFGSHDPFNALEHEVVCELLVPRHLVQVELLYLASEWDYKTYKLGFWLSQPRRVQSWSFWLSSFSWSSSI